MEQKIQQKYFAFGIIALKLGVGNSHNVEKDTWHRQSMYSQTPLRFHLTLGETFSETASLRIMQNMIKLLS